MRRHMRKTRRPHKVVCDISGQDFYADEVRKNWRGLIVGLDNWEPRHPQDFVKGRIDRQRVEGPRPDTDATLTLGTESTTASATANTVTLATLDLTAQKAVSSLLVTIADAGLPAYRDALQVRYSTTGYEELDDPLVDAIFAKAQTGSEFVIPVGRRARYLQVRAQSPNPVTVSASVNLTAKGDSVLSVSAGDL